jgi:hypothetical protein
MSRTAFRTSVPALALAVILAACGQASADVQSPSQSPADPAAPSQSARPSATPRPTPVATPVATPVSTPEPTNEPTDSPVDPHRPNIVRHELPMVGRVTADDVAVRELPDLDAPLVTGSSTTDEYEQFPNLRLDAGHEVIVQIGPVFADGLSWYYVYGDGAGPIAFLGWIAGEFLARDGEHADSLGVLDGFGNGGTVEADVPAGSTIMVTHGVNVVDSDDTCHFAMDLVRGDGSVVILADGQVTGPKFGRAAAPDAAELTQPVDGTMTLRVETDCSFAASMGLMGH